MRLKMNIRTKLILIVFSIWVIGSSLVFLSYETARNQQMDNIRTRVRDYAALGAMLVSAGDHQGLNVPEDENTEAYSRVINALRRIRDDSTDIHFVYTVRKGENGEVIFMADAEESEAEKSHLGDVYDAPELFERSCWQSCRTGGRARRNSSRTSGEHFRRICPDLHARRKIRRSARGRHFPGKRERHVARHSLAHAALLRADYDRRNPGDIALCPKHDPPHQHLRRVHRPACPG